MKLSIIGPPGSGKGMQSYLISKYFKIAHISPGEILREEFAKKTELGIKAEKYWRSGDLVPDDIILSIVKKRIKKNDCRNGFILDGFPRRLYEVEEFLRFSSFDKVILLDVPDSVSVKRITSRRECSKCDAVYGLSIIPKKKGVCDKCKGKIYQREDDKPSLVKNRLKIYHESIDPIVDFVEKKNLLLKINGVGSVDDIFDKIKNGLK